MKRIYLAKATWDAQMVRDLLVTNGIDAEAGPDYTPIHTADPKAVWILNDEDEARALEIVKGFNADASAYPKPSGIVWKWRCVTCREEIEPQFQVCWNCGAERPMR